MHAVEKSGAKKVRQVRAGIVVAIEKRRKFMSSQQNAVALITYDSTRPAGTTRNRRSSRRTAKSSRETHDRRAAESRSKRKRLEPEEG